MGHVTIHYSKLLPESLQEAVQLSDLGSFMYLGREAISVSLCSTLNLVLNDTDG